MSLRLAEGTRGKCHQDWQRGHGVNVTGTGGSTVGVSGSVWGQDGTGNEHKQDADRTEKELFGIFGIIETIKISNGKVSEVASLVLTRNTKVLSFFSFFPFFYTQSILGSSSCPGRVSLFLLRMHYFFPA